MEEVNCAFKFNEENYRMAMPEKKDFFNAKIARPL
jgi:hypothetical protein